MIRYCPHVTESDQAAMNERIPADMKPYTSVGCRDCISTLHQVA